MKLWAVIAAAGAQLAVLLFMAGEREWIARTGTPILLRTAPIDPGDPMRGEYVRLDYEISVVPRERCAEELAPWFELAVLVRNQVVYARLDIDEEGLASLDSLDLERPDEGIFLRGRVRHVAFDNLFVRYGIEAFFMQQGKARDLENELRGERRGSPLNVRARVSSRGIAVLEDYAWEPLGITLHFERSAPEAGQPRPRRELQALRVELTNHGDAPLAIVDRPGGGSFRLVRNLRWHTRGFRWVGEDSPPPKPSAQDVRILPPGESHTTRLDLADPAWFVVPEQGGAPVSLSSLTEAWRASLRIEYVPPSPEERPLLPHADIMPRRPVSSAAFTPAGVID